MTCLARPQTWATTSDSTARKCGSPWTRKISWTVWPACRRISWSVSTKRQPRRRASSRATVVLPEPLSPTSTTLPGPRRGRAGAAGLGWLVRADIRFVVLLDLGDAVTAELLAESVGQDKRDHRLADDAGRRDHADVASLEVGRSGLVGDEVDRGQRLDQRGDRLGGAAHHERCAIRDAALGAAGVVRLVGPAGAALVGDDVVDGRSPPGGL